MRLAKIAILTLILLLSMDSFAKSKKDSTASKVKKRDERINKHIGKTNQDIDLKRQKVEIENALKAPPLKHADTYVEKNPKLLEMDQEVQSIPDLESSRFEPNKNKNPDALIEKQIYDDQNREKAGNFDEKALEPGFSVKPLNKK